MNTNHVSLDPQELQDLLDELERSRQSRRRAWENLQEIRRVLKDAVGVNLPLPARKTIDLEGRIVKDGARNHLPAVLKSATRDGPLMRLNWIAVLR